MLARPRNSACMRGTMVLFFCTKHVAMLVAHHACGKQSLTVALWSGNTGQSAQRSGTHCFTSGYVADGNHSFTGR